MPLNKSEIEEIIKRLNSIMFCQSILCSDYVNQAEYVQWLETDAKFREDMLDNFEETLYRTMGIQ
jgi:hypothetical protein